MLYKHFRVENCLDGLGYRVEVRRKFLWWASGYVETNFFRMSYPTKKDALDAIERYKNSYTYINHD